MFAEDKTIGETARRAAWGRTLATEDFVTLPGSALDGHVTTENLGRFATAWSRLVKDDHVSAEVLRLRRYGRVMATRSGTGTWDLTALPHAPFRQLARHVPLYGGEARMFTPISAATLADPVLATLIGLDLDIITAASAATGSGQPRFEVGLHLIRVVTIAGTPGIPTPEGRHRDGHDYIGMHLLRRVRCSGGKSVIYRDGRAPAEVTLTKPLDSLVVIDSRIMHEVTPLVAEGGTGERDMLLVDINAC